MIYQHPLAYLLGLEGIALLRAFSGVYGRDFTTDRLSEIRALLDSAEELVEGSRRAPSRRARATTAGRVLRRAGEQVLDIEQPIVREILDGLPRGVALDAACGTGRHTAYLASLGHTVIGAEPVRSSSS